MKWGGGLALVMAVSAMGMSFTAGNFEMLVASACSLAWMLWWAFWK